MLSGTSHEADTHQGWFLRQQRGTETSVQPLSLTQSLQCGELWQRKAELKESRKGEQTGETTVLEESEFYHKLVVWGRTIEEDLEAAESIP